MFEKQKYFQCAGKRVKITSLSHLAYRTSMVMPHNIVAEFNAYFYPPFGRQCFWVKIPRFINTLLLSSTNHCLQGKYKQAWFKRTD